ncbi:hypothetical protein RF679_18160 [Undibacterium cyanobacteriorum]|uniref:Uncharacterized protein n=1 Tax=Undibacterium cyanobacteriorum TaxID=3073561 RepID=A0ABY9RH39_9BURK|nr:hypothetical protein [Undibacterium sp. 20NA77.5]WMW80541.1 hypothetical protein RF679_18160 [Undibacterium sp. 20NA77.5]
MIIGAAYFFLSQKPKEGLVIADASLSAHASSVASATERRAPSDELARSRVDSNAINAELSKRFATTQDMRAFAEWAKQHPEIGGFEYAAGAIKTCRDIKAVLGHKDIMKYGTYFSSENYSKRSAAYEKLKYQCQAYLDSELTDKAMDALVEEARHRGDVYQKLSDLFMSARHEKNLQSKNQKFNDLKKQVLDSRDPLLIEQYGPYLNVERSGKNARYWLDGVPYEVNTQAGSNMMQAWKLVACSFGKRCDEGSAEVLMACLLTNICANDYQHQVEMELHSIGEGGRIPQLTSFAKRLAEIVKGGDYTALEPKR